MPIEIKELVIKAVVSGKESEAGSAGVIKPEDMARLKKEISKEVTEKVMQAIRKKNER